MAYYSINSLNTLVRRTAFATLTVPNTRDDQTKFQEIFGHEAIGRIRKADPAVLLTK